MIKSVIHFDASDLPEEVQKEMASYHLSNSERMVAQFMYLVGTLVVTKDLSQKGAEALNSAINGLIIEQNMNGEEMVAFCIFLDRLSEYLTVKKEGLH